MLYYRDSVPRTVLYYRDSVPRTVLYYRDSVPRTVLYYRNSVPRTVLYYKDSAFGENESTYICFLSLEGINTNSQHAPVSCNQRQPITTTIIIMTGKQR
jgi:hypothetical protein